MDPNSFKDDYIPIKSQLDYKLVKKEVSNINRFRVFTPCVNCIRLKGNERMYWVDPGSIVRLNKKYQYFVEYDDKICVDYELPIIDSPDTLFYHIFIEKEKYNGSQLAQLYVKVLPGRKVFIYDDFFNSNVKKPSIIKKDDSFKKALLDTSVIKIPIVFHVIWHDSIENISDSILKIQVDILNRDFRNKNEDRLKPDHPFNQYQADTKIEFFITGINRHYTKRINFNTMEGHEKLENITGAKPWDPFKHINIYVVNLDIDGIMAYSTTPQNLKGGSLFDGVTIDYRHVGLTSIEKERGGGNVAFSSGKGNYTGGRTLVHELGHYFGLEHTFGNVKYKIDDAYARMNWNPIGCSTDYIDDTPSCTHATRGCPDFPYDANNNCGSDANGVMYMNFMDYADDACAVMFTKGQAERMRAVLNTYRKELLFVK
jgi:hypothetical protein